MDRAEILEHISKNAGLLSALESPDYANIPLHRNNSPSIEKLEEIMKLVRKVIFPGFFGSEREAQANSIQYYMGVYLERIYDLLYEQVYCGLCFDSGNCPDKRQASAIAVEFIDRIPKLKYLLSADVKAMLDGDPAANSLSEIIFSYPSILAILHQRVAHQLLLLGVPVVPRIITEMAHSATGIDIHPGARIGESFFMDHGTGIVIGETSVIGNHVKLYQGVTLGAKNFKFNEEGKVLNIPRHPVIEDHVTIYSNTSVLGRVTIGRGSVIGGNIWLTHDVPPDSRILQQLAIEE